MNTLASFVCGRWTAGKGSPRPLHNPATEEVVAETSTDGLDMAAAVAFARDRGGPALRALGFAARAEILRGMARAIHGGREELIALAIANGGNTRSDAKFDIDGAAMTLTAYAELGETLGDAPLLADGDMVQLGRTARLSGRHVWVPRRGVAVHVNAFNFPAWGLGEKAAAALLAGMPVICKPATATALVAHRMVELFVDAGVVPEGALSLVCGGPGDLLSHLGGQDVLSFTGSSDTARALRAMDAVVARSAQVNVEADSLNAAVLGPDVAAGSETEQLFLREVVRDITQKAGQKCTAIRRVYVPRTRLEDVAAALCERLGEIAVGDPARNDVRMGPVATAAQHRDVFSGIDRLAAQTEPLYGGDGRLAGDALVGVADGTGWFVGPVLRLARDPDAAPVVDEHEVFGPVATVVVYDGEPEAAAALVARGGGGLVCSVYADDRDWLARAVPELAPHHGRLYLGSAKMAAQSPGPGTVLAQLVHGGPGRAGGGEELGGTRGMALYQQRVALEGDKAILKMLTEE